MKKKRAAKKEIRDRINTSKLSAEQNSTLLKHKQ
jgi:hypothetical protein